MCRSVGFQAVHQFLSGMLVVIQDSAALLQRAGWSGEKFHRNVMLKQGVVSYGISISSGAPYKCTVMATTHWAAIYNTVTSFGTKCLHKHSNRQGMSAPTHYQHTESEFCMRCSIYWQVSRDTRAKRQNDILQQIFRLRQTFDVFMLLLQCSNVRGWRKGRQKRKNGLDLVELKNGHPQKWRLTIFYVSVWGGSSSSCCCCDWSTPSIGCKK